LKDVEMAVLKTTQTR